MHKHTVSPTIISTPAGSFTSETEVIEGDTIWNLDGVVNANGGGSNGIDFAFAGASMKSVVLLADVPCVVSFTGATPSSTTLVANVPTHITSFSGSCTAISVGANTTSSGPAGTIKIAALYNS